MSQARHNLEILGIDPGTTHSGVVTYVRGILVRPHGHVENEGVLELIANHKGAWVAIETMTPQGQPVGHSTVETTIWIGRFQQQAINKGYGVGMLRRKSCICRNICGTYKANDTAIRRALIAKLGAQTKGVTKHCWSALAVAVTFDELHLKSIHP